MEVRTKPTMYQRMLRSGLAVAFSAGAVLGAVLPLDIAWSSGKDGAGTVAAPPSDIAWNFRAAAEPSDIAWNVKAAGPSDIAWNDVQADGDIAWNSAPAGKGA